jgi:hypothetical protein
MSKKTFILFLLGAFFLSIFFHFILFQSGLYAISADESGRTLDAYQWAFFQQGYSDVWLPFYRVCIGTFLKHFPELFHTPRVVAFVFGILCFASLVWLSYELFSEKMVVVVTAYLCAVFPQRAILSVVPLSEIMFLFAVVTACVFFVRWEKYQTSANVLLSAFFFSVSASMRYEGWIFSGVLFVLALLNSRKNFLTTISIIIVLLAFPLYWMYENFIRTGNPIFFISQTAENYTTAVPISFVRLLWHNPLTQFITQNISTLNIIGMVTAFSYFSTNDSMKKLIVLCGSALVFFSLAGFLHHTLPTHNPWRISAVWSLMLLPLTAHWLYQFSRENLSRHCFIRWSMFVFVFLACVLQTATIARNSYFTKEEKNAGAFLQTKIAVKNGATKILIENPDWYYVNIIIASQHPENFVYNSGFHPYKKEYEILNTSKPLNEKYFLENNIRFFVVQSFFLTQYLNNQKNIIKLQAFGRWTIYEIQTHD